MNKESYRIFEAYRNVRSKVLNELAPVELTGGYSGSGEEVTADFPELSKGKYDLTPEETKQVFSKFISSFRNKGGKSPKLYKDFYESELAPVIRETKPTINNTNSKYTSRVLYNALKAAGVVSDERDGISGIKLEKKPSEAGVQKLADFTLKNAGEFGKEEVATGESGKGAGIDDPVMKAFWERIYGEGDFSREELIQMIKDDNEDMDDTDAKINVSSLIRTGYLEKTEDGNFTAVDPEEQGEGEQKEGEGTGEITSGYDPEEVEDIDRDEWGGVDVGPWRGSGNMD
jgi:hypothetical protein